MVFEQMLTILLGTGIGVAVVLYTVKPRQVGASQSLGSGVSSIETISLPSQSTSDSQSYSTIMPEVTATQSPAAEAPAEVFATSPGPVSTLTAEVAGTSDSAISSIDAPAVSATPARSVTVESRASSAARSHRAPRRSSAPSRTHAKPRVAGSSRAAIRKP